MAAEPKGFSDRYEARYEKDEETSDKPELDARNSPIELLALKLASYLLLVIGVISLIGVIFAAWQLYLSPESILLYSNALGNLDVTDKLGLLTLAGWVMVVLLLLTITRLAVVLIDAGLKIKDHI